MFYYSLCTMILRIPSGATPRGISTIRFKLLPDIFYRVCACCKCLCYFHPVFCPSYLSVTVLSLHLSVASFLHCVCNYPRPLPAITWDPYQPIRRSFLYHLVQAALSLNYLNFRLTVRVMYLTIPLKGVLTYPEATFK